MNLLLVVRVWARYFQVLGLLFRGLKTRDDTDLLKKQGNFVQSKAIIVQITEGHTVKLTADHISGNSQGLQVIALGLISWDLKEGGAGN